GSHNFAWAPDGRAIAFTASDGTSTKLAWIRTDGSGETKTIFQKPDLRPWVDRWSRDGRSLAILLRSPSTSELAVLPVDGGSPPRTTDTVKSIASQAGAPSFSPDGRWIAYCDCGPGVKVSQVFLKRV